MAENEQQVIMLDKVNLSINTRNKAKNNMKKIEQELKLISSDPEPKKFDIDADSSFQESKNYFGDSYNSNQNNIMFKSSYQRSSSNADLNKHKISDYSSIAGKSGFQFRSNKYRSKSPA